MCWNIARISFSEPRKHYWQALPRAVWFRIHRMDRHFSDTRKVRLQIAYLRIVSQRRSMERSDCEEKRGTVRSRCANCGYGPSMCPFARGPKCKCSIEYYNL